MDFKKSPPTHLENVDDLDEEAAHEDSEALREGNNNRDYLLFRGKPAEDFRRYHRRRFKNGGGR
jgi:hypothetical protein